MATWFSYFHPGYMAPPPLIRLPEPSVTRQPHVVLMFLRSPESGLHDGELLVAGNTANASKRFLLH